MDIEALFLKFALLGAGWVLWLLVILSVVSMGVMIERIIYLVRGRLDMGTAAADLTKALDDGGSEQVRKVFSDRLNSPEGRILMAGVEKHQGGAESAERANIEALR